MKRKNFAFLLAAMLLLPACSSSGGNSAAPAPTAVPAAADAAAEYSGGYDVADYEMAEAYSSAEGGGIGATAGEAVRSTDASSYTDKIIYSASAEIETTEFDQSVEAAYQMLERYDAFIESSSVSGVNLVDQKRGYFGGRSARFTFRVSAADYSEMVYSLSGLGNVLYQSSDAQNVSYQYYDTESRLNTYRTEEERLFSMLEKAVNVEEMIAIEERLSNVRYEIESLTTTLTNLQNQIDYSTVTVYISEVFEYTEETVPVTQLTYGQRLTASLSNSIAMVGRFFKQLLIFMAAAIPILFIPAVIAIVVWRVIIWRREKTEA